MKFIVLLATALFTTTAFAQTCPQTLDLTNMSDESVLVLALTKGIGTCKAEVAVVSNDDTTYVVYVTEKAITDAWGATIFSKFIAAKVLRELNASGACNE